MMSPLKLSVIVCGAAAGLAVAPYLVKQVFPPDAGSLAERVSTAAPASSSISQKVDLPVAGQNTAAAVVPPPAATVAAAPPAIVQAPVDQTRAELTLPSAALPSPASKPAEEISLPSLSATPAPVVASATLPAPVVTPAPTPRPTPAPTPEIPYRSEVEQAQKYMGKLGLSTGKIDGKLGPNTQKAVKEFQSKNGLEANGEVTQPVLDAMDKAVAALATPAPKIEVTEAVKTDELKISQADDPTAVVIRKGESAPEEVKSEIEVKADPGPVPTLKTMDDVKKLQARLKDSGTYDGDVDGRWGDLTRSAMRAFQEKSSLEVTGKPNEETWRALNSSQVASKPQAKPVSTADTATRVEVAASSDAAQQSDANETVVTLNGDGSSKPEALEPMATPKAVSSLKSGDKPEKKTTGKADKSSDLATAQVDRDNEKAALKKEIEATRASIKSVSNDSDLEVKKYAPKVMETVNTMASQLGENDDDPEEVKAAITRINAELDKAKNESQKKKADVLVTDVRKSYNSLKATFSDRIKSLTLEDKDEKKQREEITDFVADIDKGFDAMEADYKKGKFDPIFKNGEGFRKTIDEVNQGLAEMYVKDKLADKAVKSKLSKSDVTEIQKLVDQQDHLRAADKLDKAISSSSRKKS